MPERPHSKLIAVQRAVARLCRSDWQLEDGDVLVPTRWRADTFKFEHTFRPGEFDREAASAGLRIVFRNREAWVFVLQRQQNGRSKSPSICSDYARVRNSGGA
jgi:hypothetical protein